MDVTQRIRDRHARRTMTVSPVLDNNCVIGGQIACHEVAELMLSAKKSSRSHDDRWPLTETLIGDGHPDHIHD